jgi:hypothetical protein
MAVATLAVLQKDCQAIDVLQEGVLIVVAQIHWRVASQRIIHRATHIQLPLRKHKTPFKETECQGKRKGKKERKKNRERQEISLSCSPWSMERWLPPGEQAMVQNHV